MKIRSKKTLKRPDRTPWRDYFFILVGSAVMGLGIGVFLVDARVVPGGVSGLSMVIHYLTEGRMPVGLTMWILNIPLYIWGVRELGKQFGTRTFVGFSANSFFVDFFRGSIPGLASMRLNNRPGVLFLLENDFLLCILAGATLLGLGLGIIFKFRGTTAGSDVIAAVARKKTGIKPGQTFMIVDTFVILLAAVTIQFKHMAFDRPVLSLTLYAFLLLIVSSRIVDIIIDGFDYARSATIVTSKPEEVSEIILKEMKRGATYLEGHGAFTGSKRHLIYSVLNRNEISKLVEKVKRVDAHAFIIVENVHEVLGEGFRPRI